jgi:hypothetical protein
MDRRLALFLLVAILATVAAVPALAGQTTVTPSLDRKSVAGALAKAKLALKIARSASSKVTAAREEAKEATGRAAAAQAAASGAGLAAGQAKTAADGAAASSAATQAALDSTRVKQAIAKAEAETESATYVSLAGGPSVVVEVPASGLIEVWAQVSFGSKGAVALFEDGKLMPGQAQHCIPGEEPGDAGVSLLTLAFEEGPPVTLSTPSTPNPFLGICGIEGPPAPVLFEATPGTHTYELRYRYADCGCPPEPGEEPISKFSDRRLAVGPRL